MRRTTVQAVRGEPPDRVGTDGDTEVSFQQARVRKNAPKPWKLRNDDFDAPVMDLRQLTDAIDRNIADADGGTSDATLRAMILCATEEERDSVAMLFMQAKARAALMILPSKKHNFVSRING